MEPTRRVLFVCLHGSGKSLIAAEYFRRLAAQRGLEIGARSAGIEPDLQIPRSVIKGLSKDSIDVRGRIPRRVAREDLANAWRVVSFGWRYDFDEAKLREADPVPEIFHPLRAKAALFAGLDARAFEQLL